MLYTVVVVGLVVAMLGCVVAIAVLLADLRADTMQELRDREAMRAGLDRLPVRSLDVAGREVTVYLPDSTITGGGIPTYPAYDDGPRRH